MHGLYWVELSWVLPEFFIHGLYGEIDAVDLVLHVAEFLQQLEGAVQLIQRLDVEFQPVTDIGPV